MDTETRPTAIAAELAQQALDDTVVAPTTQGGASPACEAPGPAQELWRPRFPNGDEMLHPRARRTDFAGMNGRVVFDHHDELVVRFRVFDGTEEDWLWRRCPGEREWYEQLRRIQA